MMIKNKKIVVLIAALLLVLTLMPISLAARDENDYFSIEVPSGYEKNPHARYSDKYYQTEYTNSNMTIDVEVTKHDKGEAVNIYDTTKNLIEDTKLYNGKTVDTYSKIGPSDYDIFSCTIKSAKSYRKYYFIATDHYFVTVSCYTNGKRQFINNEKSFDNTVKSLEIFDDYTDPESVRDFRKVFYAVIGGTLLIVAILVVKGVMKIVKEQEAAKTYTSHLENNKPEEQKEEKKYNNYEEKVKENEEKKKDEVKYSYNPGYNYNFEVGKENKGSYYSEKDLNKYIRNENKDDGNNENE